MRADVSVSRLEVHCVCCSVWFQQGGEVFVFHLPPFISYSLVNWYWGHCLQKPSSPLKEEEGGGREQQKVEWKNIIYNQNERTIFREERKKETLHRPVCQSNCGPSIDQPDRPTVQLLSRRLQNLALWGPRRATSRTRWMPVSQKVDIRNNSREMTVTREGIRSRWWFRGAGRFCNLWAKLGKSPTGCW